MRRLEPADFPHLSRFDATAASGGYFSNAHNVVVKKVKRPSGIQTKIRGKIKTNDYIWLWLETLEGSGDNQGGLQLFITIQTPGREKQTQGRTEARGEGAPDRFCEKRGKKYYDLLPKLFSAGVEEVGEASGLTAGPGGHLVNFNDHPDPRYPAPLTPHAHPPTFSPSLLALLMGATFPPDPG